MRGLTTIERQLLIDSLPERPPFFIEAEVPAGTEDALAARGLLRRWVDADGLEWFETTGEGRRALTICTTALGAGEVKP